MVMKEQPEGMSRVRRDEPKVDPETGKNNKAQEYTIFYQAAKGQPKVEIGHTQRANGKWIPVLTGTTIWPDPFLTHNEAMAWMREQHLKAHPAADLSSAAVLEGVPAAEVESLVETGEPEQGEFTGTLETGEGQSQAPSVELEVTQEEAAEPGQHEGAQSHEQESVRVIPDVPQADLNPWPEVGGHGTDAPVAAPQLPEDWMTTPPPPPESPQASDAFADPFGPGQG